MMDKTKRIRTAAAELTWARLRAIWIAYAPQYIEGHLTSPVSIHWPTPDELKVFERLLDEVRSETLHEARTTCFKMLENDHVKTTGSEVYDRLYREVFSEIAVPALTSEKKRVNDDEKEAKSTGDHQDRECAVEHPAEIISAPAHRGKRRGRRGPDAE